MLARLANRKRNKVKGDLPSQMLVSKLLSGTHVSKDSPKQNGMSKLTNASKVTKHDQVICNIHILCDMPINNTSCSQACSASQSFSRAAQWINVDAKFKSVRVKKTCASTTNSRMRYATA